MGRWRSWQGMFQRSIVKGIQGHTKERCRSDAKKVAGFKLDAADQRNSLMTGGDEVLSWRK